MSSTTTTILVVAAALLSTFASTTEAADVKVVAPPSPLTGGFQCRSGYYYGHSCKCIDFEAGGAFFAQKNCIDDVNREEKSVTWVWGGCSAEERDAEIFEGQGAAPVANATVANAKAFADLIAKHSDKLPCFGRQK